MTDSILGLKVYVLVPPIVLLKGVPFYVCECIFLGVQF